MKIANTHPLHQDTKHELLNSNDTKPQDEQTKQSKIFLRGLKQIFENHNQERKETRLRYLELQKKNNLSQQLLNSSTETPHFLKSTTQSETQSSKSVIQGKNFVNVIL